MLTLRTTAALLLLLLVVVVLLLRASWCRHLLNRLRKSQALDSLSKMLRQQCEQQERDIAALEEGIRETESILSRYNVDRS